VEEDEVMDGAVITVKELVMVKEDTKINSRQL
jgi:hypothetical protein